MKSLKIVSRGSHLALTQAALVAACLREKAIEYKPDIIIYSKRTIGDVLRYKWREVEHSLSKNQRAQKWTDTLETAVVEGEADIAVHSAKDLSWQESDFTEIIPVLVREDPRDVFISSTGKTLEHMPIGFKIGTDSPRRRALAKSLRPDAQFVEYSGNVTTRIKSDRMKERGVDGIIIASAGLKRLNISMEGVEFLSPHTFLPAVNQGILAVQIRKDAPEEIKNMVQLLVNPETEAAFLAERGVRKKLQADCNASFGAFAWSIPNNNSKDVTSHINLLRLRARALSADGTTAIEFCDQAQINESPSELGTRVAEKLIDQRVKDLWSSARDPVISYTP